MSTKSPMGLRIIAIFKLVSACLLAAAGIGIFRLIDKDLGEVAEHTVRWLHLDPAHHVVTDLMATVAGVTPGKLKLIDAATFFYALLYIIEGIGLLRGAHWAEYLVIVATASLVPFEVMEVMHKPGIARIAILVINLAIVAYLIVTLVQERKRKALNPTSLPAEGTSE